MARKDNRPSLGVILAVTDIILINLAFLMAYWMRYTLWLGGEVVFQNYVSLDDYLEIQVGLTILLIISLVVAGVYRQSRGASVIDEIGSVIGGTSFGMMITLAGVFLYQGYAFSRLIFAFVWALVIVFLTLSRIIKSLVRGYLQRKGVGLQRILVVGSGSAGVMVMHVIATEPGLGYRLVGFVDDHGNGDVGRFKSLGPLDSIGPVIREHQVDEVVIALPSASHKEFLTITEHCKQNDVNFRIVPDVYEMSLTRVDVDDFRGVPVIGLKEISIQGLNLWLKRAVDVTASALLLLITLPIFATASLLIKATSSGPVFFRQIRQGKKGRTFVAYKFRSMRQDAEQQVHLLSAFNEASGPLFKMKNDPRITFIGKLLRKSSLDELPQLWNVLKGDMSLVGPRPPIPSEVEKYEDWHRKRLEVAPGLTGLWQVSGRSDLPFDEMVMLDIYYIENWSLGLDFKILLRTVPAVISGRGAY